MLNGFLLSRARDSHDKEEQGDMSWAPTRRRYPAASYQRNGSFCMTGPSQHGGSPHVGVGGMVLCCAIKSGSLEPIWQVDDLYPY